MKKNPFMFRLCAAALTGAMALSLTACGGEPADSTSAPADNTANTTAPADTGEKHQVGIVLKTTSSEYWSYVIAGIRAAEQELGNVEVTVNGATGDTAFKEQQDLVETLVGSGSMEAMAIAPLQADAITNALKNADMPILAIDTNFDRAQTFIGTAHEDAAYQGGKYVAEQIGQGGKVVILANIQAEPTSESRVAGYKKALEEGGCEVLEVQYTDGVSNKAVTTMDGVLQVHPDLDAVVCCADDVALGAAHSIEMANRQDDGILVCGFDGISSGVQAVADGKIGCTVAQDPYNMGYQCVKSLMDVLDGKELPAFIDTGCKVITPDNAQEYLDKLQSLV